jgi:sporadic carbohydrate cluster 2OG-Fe(II) oxygenase
MYTEEKNELIHKGFIHFNSNIQAEIQTLNRHLIQVANNTFLLDLKNIDDLHLHISPASVNDFRLKMISEINQHKIIEDLKEKHAEFLQELLGRDLAMQKHVNLVLSLPNDETSQIPLHSDVWTGHSPFELNLWIPLNDVESEMSMFILPLPAWRNYSKKEEIKNSTLKKILKEINPELYYVKMNAGNTFVFWHHLPHGNHKHQFPKTRWSLNIRVKNLFTPYGEKSFGEYFVPWKKSELTEMVLSEKEFFL